MALATPTQTHATLDGASASLVAQALQQGLQQSTNAATQRAGTGNREADGGWCISWCKDKYWGEVIAAGCGTTGVIKVRTLLNKPPLLTLDSKYHAIDHPNQCSSVNDPPHPLLLIQHRNWYYRWYIPHSTQPTHHPRGRLKYRRSNTFEYQCRRRRHSTCLGFCYHLCCMGTFMWAIVPPRCDRWTGRTREDMESKTRLRRVRSRSCQCRERK